MKWFRRLAIVYLLLAAAPAHATVSIAPSLDVYGPGTAVSSTTTYYSVKSSLAQISKPSYDLYWTGTPTGTFTVWVSNKKNPSEANDADWKQLTLARPIIQPAGSASGDYVDLSGLPFAWVRLKYVNASSTGTIDAYYFGKQ